MVSSSQTTVLVVEDDTAIRRGLVDSLAYAGYDSVECGDGQSAIERAADPAITLVLLDVMLPDVDGFSVLTQVRQIRPTLPVIMVTARGAEEDRIRGLRDGADDYVVKPFSARELLARVEAVLRRAPENWWGVRSLTHADCRINLEERRVSRQEVPDIHLTEREAALLRYLAANSDRAVDRRELFERVWGINPDGIETRTVDMHVARLRDKVETDPTLPKIVITVRGIGYRLGNTVVAEKALKSHRLLWGVYAIGAGFISLTLLWISMTVVRLERSERGARADAQQQETMRLALWRMDSWLMPRLARESARPYFEYQPFYPQARAYTRLLYQIEPGDVITPSPLLTFQSEYIRLHFQISPQGNLSSPQVPVGALRDLAKASLLDSARIEANLNTMFRLSQVLPRESVVSCVAESEERDTRLALGAVQEFRALKDAELRSFAAAPQSAKEELRTEQEWSKRKGSFLQNLDAAAKVQRVAPILDDEGQQDIAVGSFVPIWVEGIGVQSAQELVFIRRVQVQNSEYYQGFLCDWPALRSALQSEVKDLATESDISPIAATSQADAPRGTMLATIPASLNIAGTTAIQSTLFTPVRATIGVAWLAVLLGMAAVAVTLRQSVALGEKRSRFATTVTHELRTPLTTFRMYTEMLAEGMVQDEEQRQTYLETLKDESARLASLVENVLSYAQLEEGRRVTKRTDITSGDLIGRIQPLLEQRATNAGMVLAIETDLPVETIIRTDVESYGQIVFNLIDNACKYAFDAGDRSIQLRLTIDGGRLLTTVCDHGSGIAAEQARMIFAPFERGAYSGSDKPGIGLGLALSRGLARDLGGDLICKPGQGGGACFELLVPIV